MVLESHPSGPLCLSRKPASSRRKDSRDPPKPAASSAAAASSSASRAPQTPARSQPAAPASRPEWRQEKGDARRVEAGSSPVRTCWKEAETMEGESRAIAGWRSPPQGAVSSPRRCRAQGGGDSWRELPPVRLVLEAAWLLLASSIKEAAKSTALRRGGLGPMMTGRWAGGRLLRRK